MSPIKSLSQIAATLVCTVCMYQPATEATPFGSSGNIFLYDPSGTSNYLGSSALSGTRLGTGAGSQYKFSTNFSGAYNGVSVSGTISIGEIDFIHTGAIQVDIANELNRAKIFKLSNLTITNNSSNTLNYRLPNSHDNGAVINGSTMFYFENGFSRFSLAQFYAVIDGEFGKLGANGNLTCNQNANFYIRMDVQLRSASTGSLNQAPTMYADQTTLDSNCNFKAKKASNSNIAPGDYNLVIGTINSLSLPQGYTLKMTNSFNMFVTNSKVPLTAQNVEDLINVSIGKQLDDPSRLKFKVFSVDNNGQTGAEITVSSREKVPAPSSLFGLLTVGGILISIAVTLILLYEFLPLSGGRGGRGVRAVSHKEWNRYSIKKKLQNK